MSSKKFKPGFMPRPTKTLLTALAAKQHEVDAAKEAEGKTEEQPKAEPEVLAIVDTGEVTPSDIATVTEVLAPTNDGAAAPEQASVQAPGTEQAAAPSPPAAATPAPTAGKPPKGTNDGQYTIGKKYNPKTDRNSETWGKITKALAEGPKTMKELTEVVKGHNDFLGYMTRNGHIIPHKVEAVSG